MQTKNIYKVFVASPNDAKELRNIAKEVIGEWNDRCSDSTNAVLIPVLWETCAVPGNRPAQQTINEDLLEGTDLVVAIWRFVWGAGTAEEIERSIRSGKREVLQYFSVEDVPFHYTKDARREALEEYRDRMTREGEPFYWTYGSEDAFRKSFTRHLDQSVSNLIRGKRHLRAEDFTKDEQEFLIQAARSLKITYDRTDTKFYVQMFYPAGFITEYVDEYSPDGKYSHIISSLYGKRILINQDGTFTKSEVNGKCFINPEKRREVENVIIEIG